MSDGMHIDFDQAAFRKFKMNKRQFRDRVLNKASDGLKDSAVRIVAVSDRKSVV